VRQITNPPNPYSQYSAEYVGEPPPTKLEIFEELSTRKMITKAFASDWEGGWRYTVNCYRGCVHGCTYCFARRYHEFLGYGAGTDFETKIVVKPNAPQVLREELKKTRQKMPHIDFSFATDPYLPLEASYELTRKCLIVCADFGVPVGVITKSPLVTRDIDLLSRINRISDLSIHISLITLDRELARRIEPRAPTPESRVRALARLREAGIAAGINCMPVLPGITDNPSDLEALVKRVSEAGATYVGACAVRLKPAAKKRYLPFIEQEFPHLAERYRNTFANSAYAGEKYREGLAHFFGKICAKYGVRDWSRRDQEDEGDESPTPALVPDVQLSLNI